MSVSPATSSLPSVFQISLLLSHTKGFIFFLSALCTKSQCPLTCGNVSPKQFVVTTIHYSFKQIASASRVMLTAHFCVFAPNQELPRRAPSTAQRTEPRTSSWSWRTAWRSARGTNPRSLNSFRRCSPSWRPRTSRTWSRSSRACSMVPRSGRPRSASQVRAESDTAQKPSSLHHHHQSQETARVIDCMLDTVQQLNEPSTGGSCRAVEQKDTWFWGHLCVLTHSPTYMHGSLTFCFFPPLFSPSAVCSGSASQG